MASTAAENVYYQVKPLKLGVEIQGVSLKQDPPREVIEQIKRDVHKYRLLVFREQGILSGKRHVEISQWFGELDSTFYRHPRSPDPDVFRVSNDESEGCTNVGRTGWHIDGSFQPAPFAYSLYHIISVPEQGDTVFIPLNELIMSLSEEQRNRWERLWMVSDRRGGIVHPLIYSHPVTGQKTMCFHLGMTEGFIWDYGQSSEQMASAQETRSILMEIHNKIVNDCSTLQYSHHYKPGDFMISDNLALGHEATPETQWPRSKVGLRVMHRTTVKGFKPPAKNYAI
jgi:alpha-ketoglutarate-dependent taurine dioxygenase